MHFVSLPCAKGGAELARRKDCKNEKIMVKQSLRHFLAKMPPPFAQGRLGLLRFVCFFAPNAVCDNRLNGRFVNRPYGLVRAVCFMHQIPSAITVWTGDHRSPLRVRGVTHLFVVGTGVPDCPFVNNI